MKFKPWHGRGTTKPGEFRAYCRKGRWVELHDLVGMDPDTLVSRWDPNARANVFAVPCNVEFDDRKAFERHMAEGHGVKPGTGHRAGSHINGRHGTKPAPEVKPLGKGMWTGPRLTATGTSLTDNRNETQTCPDCGLVAEVDDRAANVLWWDEHLRGCAIAHAESGAA